LKVFRGKSKDAEQVYHHYVTLCAIVPAVFVLCSMNSLPFLVWYLLHPHLAILTFVNYAVSVLILILSIYCSNTQTVAEIIP